ncbi:transglycosylase [Erwinia phage vB_EamM_ChrisDB]|uniref:transglycosylase n=1 Tax=Erwinia phage vB_EamM_ChrisDB TaxID=1883371 RepID=UPI00081D208C|nr:transglycosylase [Erwinia phage vB_EamM_ChrisDB]ANZ48781.1 putative endolysin [Erwinia phage vB_EamM_ChrisDB]
MFRIIFLILAVMLTFNAHASKSTSAKKDYSTEFAKIEHRFVKVKPMIEKISAQQGVHAGLMTTLIYKESRFDPKAKNKEGSSAHSLVQMTRPTKRSMLKLYGKQLGLPKNADLNNPRNAILLATAYLNHIEGELERRLKRKPTNAEIYLGYRFGEGTAYTMIKKKSPRGAREMRQYKRDASFYSALVEPVVTAETPKQLAFVKTDDTEKVIEIQQIWHTLYGAYAPVTSPRQLAANNINIGANLEHRHTTLVSRIM